MRLTPEQQRLLFRYDRELPLNAESSVVSNADGVHVERFAFDSSHGQHVPTVLYRPEAPAEPSPLIVIGHGAA